MYSLFQSGLHITLWCDGSDKKENQVPTKKKRTEESEKPEKTEKSGSKREAAEEELKEILDQLKTIIRNLYFCRFEHHESQTFSLHCTSHVQWLFSYC